MRKENEKKGGARVENGRDISRSVTTVFLQYD
jgi:hypothetical protein